MNRLDGRTVLAELVERANRALAGRGLDAWSCVRAVPRIDGSLYFDLTSNGPDARIDWPGPLAGEPADGPGLVWSGDGPGPRAAKVLDALAGLVDGLRGRPEFALIDLHNQDRAELIFDDGVVDLLLAERFGPGVTRWFGYRFTEAFQDSAEAFGLVFDGPTGRVEFRISQAGSGASHTEAERVLANHLFAIDLTRDPRSPAQRRLLPHQVERFLGFLLCRAVHADMRLRPVAAGSSRPAAGGERPDGDRASIDGARTDSFDGAPISTTRWGNPKQWYQFFSDFEVERSSLCSVRFTDPIAYVVHGEMECKGIEPDTFGRRVEFANPPWPMEPVESAPGSQGFFTGLVEQDAIMGGTAKLEHALAQAAGSPSVRLVCLNNTCLPKIIGDDVVSAVARARATSPVPILSMNTDLDSPDAAFRDLVRQALEAAAGDGPQGRGGGLNLIGFPPGAGRRELLGQLEDVDLAVQTCLIPEFGVADLRRYMAGRAGLLYPHRPWIELAEGLLRDLEVPFEQRPAPYGPRRTREWVRAAAQAAKRPEAFERWQERHYGPALERFSRLTDQARGLRLGFVVDTASLGRLVDPTRMYGFEIAALLEEMGFDLDVLVFDPAKRTEPPPEWTSALAEPERHRLTPFARPAELEALLHDGAFQAVYSEVFFDRRTSRSGKAQFHLGMLELGLDGACRGLERLLALCRWPFYRRYRAYLGDSEAAS